MHNFRPVTLKLVLAALIFSASSAFASAPQTGCEQIFAGAPAEHASEEPPPLSPADQIFEVQLRQMLDGIEAFWQARFDERGWPYRPVRLHVYSQWTDSKCGKIRRSQGPIYCNADETIFIDLGSFAEMETYVGKTTFESLLYTMAHEYGHHIQVLRGALYSARLFGSLAVKGPRAKALEPLVEFQADCLAGVMFNHAVAAGALTMAEMQIFSDRVRRYGDDYISRRYEELGLGYNSAWDHGKGADRKKWFLTGAYDGRPEACEPFEQPVLASQGTY